MSVTHARALITKHHKYAWVFTLSALLIVGGIYFKKDLAQAATYTFTQTSWMGGVSATTAVDPTDRTGWTKYSTSTSITAGSNVALVLNSFSFTDDGATSTTPTTTAFGGGFSNGATSSTIVTGVSTTTAASVGLAYAPITNVSEIKTGSNTTCVVKTDSTAYCWGLNNIGQLGDNTTVSKSTGVQVHGVANSGFLTGVAQISSGISTTCAVKTDGTVYCWGNNSYGQLGDNTTVNKSTPVQVLGVGGSGFLTGVAQISTGGVTTCALKTDGTVYCWGRNFSGQLGDNTTVNKSTPVQVLGVGASGFLTGVAQISTGQAASTGSVCAVKTDGTLYCWGENSWAQLGDNTTVNKSTPVQVHGVANSGFLTGVAQISTGGNTICALKTDGTAYCWGYNDYGQIGDNTTVYKATPVQVHGVANSGFLTGVAQISTGGNSQVVSPYSITCAVKTDGTAYCWGSSFYGQLGDNTTVNKSTPVQVHGVANSGFLTGVAHIKIGGNTICALKTDGTAYCWGYNNYGQIGDNTTVNKSTPVQPLLNFYTSGTFTSAVINLGAKANLTTFSASTTIPAGTAITFDVRAGDSATPPAWGSTDSNWTSVGLTGVSASSGSISALGAHQYIQYRANLTTPSPYTTTPTLGSVTINNIGQYTISGNLTSSAYDTGDATNLITKLSWVGSTTTTETIKFQVQSSADGVTWSV
jgi:alpha-tubulin suppressor-like RCC1 family protein